MNFEWNQNITLLQSRILFCTVIAPPKKQKRSFTDFRRKIDKNVDKAEIFAYFCVYIQIYYLRYILNKRNPSYLKFYLKSVSYN